MTAVSMVDWEVFYNSFRKPDFIPGYEIQNRLGGGAFGDVYKARKRSIGKIYAVKFLKLDEAAQREVVERELEQVRLFSSIDHPHLVTIEDMGVVMDVPYLVMGYAGEDTLARCLKRGDLDRESALRYFVQACRGVLALHERRLAHFDVKPSNIFIKGDVARVGDYGLAKLLADGRQTLSFGRGTPHYMAPEMLKNRADHRADIYSLGVILYESLTGKVPFESDSGFGALLREDDRPPEFPPGFPVELRPVVERALRVDPDKRYPNLNEMLAELGQSARQGDSVHIPWSPAPAGAGRAPGRVAAAGVAGASRPAPAAPGAPDEETSLPSGAEFKRAAQELVRGAVEVARGVWDGVSGATDELEAPPARPAEPRRAGGGDVVTIKTLDEPDAPAAGRRAEPAAERAAQELVSDADEGAARRPKLPWRRRHAAAEERPREVGPPAPVPAGGAARGAAGTIPVPPAVQGGVVGTLVSAGVLGVEVLVSLVTGPILYLVRGAGRVADRGVRFVPGVLGRLVRLVVLLLLMMIAGAVCAAVALMLVTQPW